jgi:hypothetical protein
MRRANNQANTSRVARLRLPPLDRWTRRAQRFTAIQEGKGIVGGEAEGIDGGEVAGPAGMGVVPGEETAGAHPVPPVAQGVAVLVAGVGVAVDGGEAPGDGREQGEG